MRYWLDVFSEETWSEFEAAGSNTSGFPGKQWSKVKDIKIGDVLIGYTLGKKVFHAVMNVTGEPRQDTSLIWKSGTYPSRIPVSIDIDLQTSDGVPIESLKERLSWFRDLKHPSAWTYRLFQSPYEVSPDDAKVIIEAIHIAAKKGCGVEKGAEPTHDGIQWLLLSLGNEMGLDLWVASNDRNKSFQGNVFSSLPRLQQTLPVQFDFKSQRIIEFIDVLWLRGNSIIAAFEIEHTTSIYSGLLRMSDLMTLQPNININLFVVAPDDRREKVRSEIKRPTFDNARLPRVCRYIAYSKLTNRIDQAKTGGFLRYLNPSFLDEIAEDLTE
ncbi:MAG: EVE domain-containing protein [Chloroflexi bacterium]|nr:EVE domain-containing protein [Chloroflexota bacterium]